MRVGLSTTAIFADLSIATSSDTSDIRRAISYGNMLLFVGL